MKDDLYVLAMETPGRYIVGMSHGPDGDTITLDNAAHVTCIESQWSFQDISLLRNFSAKLSAYAGFGLANAECEKHYRTWRQYVAKPPSFEVQEDD